MELISLLEIVRLEIDILVTRCSQPISLLTNASELHLHGP